MTIQKISIKPKYRRENGLWSLPTQTLPFPADFNVIEQAIVYIPPQQVGGNHKHPRQEAFIGIGKDLFLIWQDESGSNHQENMYSDTEMTLFIIPPNVPHAVINKAKDTFAILYEFADAVQQGVISVSIV